MVPKIESGDWKMGGMAILSNIPFQIQTVFSTAIGLPSGSKPSSRIKVPF